MISVVFFLLFFFNFINYCVIVSFLTKVLMLGILFSPALRAVVLAELVIQYYNHGNNNNILRRFDVLPKFINNKHGIYELPHKLLNDLRLRIFGN